MKHQITYLHCGEHLKESLKDEIDEVLSVVNLIEWKEEFKVIKPDSTLLHQTAYNKRFEISLNHVLHYEEIKDFVKHFQVRSFITTYENIPWEPMCLLALKETSPKTISIGYQHSNVSEFETNYFLSEYELNKRPMPDRIFTIGPITKRIIEKNSFGKYPFIESSCALRYKYLDRKINRPRKKQRRILVALEGLPDVYHLVNYILNELSQANNYEIIVRPHPILPMAKIDKHIQIDYSKFKNMISTTQYVQTIFPHDPPYRANQLTHIGDTETDNRDILFTYVNLDEIEYLGFDISLEYQLNNKTSLSSSYSYYNTFDLIEKQKETGYIGNDWAWAEYIEGTRGMSSYDIMHFNAPTEKYTFGVSVNDLFKIK